MVQHFNEWVKADLAPILKAAGFRKKSLNFFMERDGLFFLINLQKSHGNSAVETTFYVNCCIHSFGIEEEVRGSRTSFPKESQCYFRERVENVVEGLPDRFVIRTEVDRKRIQNQMEKAIPQVLALFAGIQEDKQLVRLLAERGTLETEEIFRYCIRKNLKEEATQLATRVKENIGSPRWEEFFRDSFREILDEEDSDWKLEILA